MLYLYAFISVRKLHDDFLKSQGKETHVAVALNESMSIQSQRSLELSQMYSKIVLHCSNFEQQKEDEKFFECLFYFTCFVTRLGLAQEHWGAAEVELGRQN